MQYRDVSFSVWMSNIWITLEDANVNEERFSSVTPFVSVSISVDVAKDSMCISVMYAAC